MIYLQNIKIEVRSMSYYIMIVIKHIDYMINIHINYIGIE